MRLADDYNFTVLPATDNPVPVSAGAAVDDARPTPLAASLPFPTLVVHGGARTPQFFDSASGEIDALLTSAGVIDLGWRSKIQVTGKDRLRWLNGMLTNTVQALPQDQGNYSFALNAQGRIQGDCYVYRRAEDLFLDTGSDQAAALLGHLRHYIIMDEVELEEVSGQWTALGLAGPNALRVLSSLGVAISGASPENARLFPARIQGIEAVVVEAYHVLVPRYELWFPPSEVAAIWESLRAAGAIAAGVSAAEALRILEGTPLYGVDLGERDLPQETRQTRALNFTKGCYLGQEIVERIRSRGKIHRGLRQFRLNGVVPSPPFDLRGGGQPVGRITSTASFSSPRISGNFALGFVREESLERQEALEYEGGTAVLINTPSLLSDHPNGERIEQLGESNA